MRRAFGEGEGTLVLVADPKQAIYAFRGADVYAYLDAAASRRVDRRPSTVNRRSDQRLLDAFDALFGNAKLGHAGIAYRRVRAAPAHPPARLRRPAAPLRVRVVDRLSSGVTQKGFATAAGARDYIARDLASDLVRLLSSNAPCPGRKIANRSAHAMWPCSWAQIATPPSCARRSKRRACRRSSTGPEVCFGPRVRATGCVCSKRWSGPAR